MKLEMNKEYRMRNGRRIWPRFVLQKTDRKDCVVCEFELNGKTHVGLWTEEGKNGDIEEYDIVLPEIWAALCLTKRDNGFAIQLSMLFQTKEEAEEYAQSPVIGGVREYIGYIHFVNDEFKEIVPK